MSNIFDENELNTAFGDWGNWLQGKISGVNFSPVLPRIREVIKNSIDRNFSEGGRFGDDNPWQGGSFKWVKSGRATKQSGQTLVDTGHLRKSIQVKVVQVGNGIQIIMGSNLEYAAVHQFGYDGEMSVSQHTRKIKTRNVKQGKKGKTIAMGFAYVKAHTRNASVPSRPFLTLQDEDMEQIIEIMIEFFVNKFLK